MLKKIILLLLVANPSLAWDNTTAQECLATAIYFEARSESVEGQGAVADVVINRVNDKRYPNSICKVVFEQRQFSFTHDDKSDIPAKGMPLDIAVAIAKASIASDVRYVQATHYHTKHVNPKWSKVFAYNETIGLHLFYTNDTKYR